MSQIDTVLRQVEVMRKALAAQGSGAFSRVLSIYGERSPAEIKALINAYLADFDMDYDELVEAGIDGEIRLVYLKWLTTRRVTGNDTNHQSAGLDPLDHELSTLSRMSEDEKLTHPPLLPPSHQQTMPGDPSTGIQAGMQSKDDRP